MNMQSCSLLELANSMGAGDKPRASRVSLTKEKLSQLSVGKSHSIYELPLDETTMTTRPWRNLPKHFTQVLISTVALVKMSAHAKTGGSVEVMGMLTGKTVRNLFIVMDVYALPVEGTETRVNAQSEAYEFMVQYLDNFKEVRPKDSIVGWYHSHPGYGCWLSGIDVATQSLNQNFQDPYLAIVVDPSRTQDQGKVEIGAFRTFPVGYVDDKKAKGHEAETHSAVSSLRNSNHDMGAHSDRYYSLEIKLFKGPRDDKIVNLILDKSWVSSITHSHAYTRTYEQNMRKKVELLMKRELFANQSRTGTTRSGRYERLFERIVSMHCASHTTPGSQVKESKAFGNKNYGGLIVEGLRRLINEGEYEEVEDRDVNAECGTDDFDIDEDEDENEDEILDGAEDADNDSESRIGLDANEDDDDAQNLPMRDVEEYTGAQQGFDNAALPIRAELEQLEDLSFFEEYEAGHGIADNMQKKSLKRNLHTSSEDSRSSLPFDSSTSLNKKRFASGDFSSAVDNELKYRMRSLQLELQHHVKEALSSGQAELLELLSRRAQQRVFAKRDW